MWYSFQLITAVREKSERARIYAEIRQFLVFCRDPERIDAVIHSEAEEHRPDGHAIEIFDNADLQMEKPLAELRRVDGVRLPDAIKSVKRMPNLAEPEQFDDVEPSEVSHLIFIFDTEEEYSKLVASHSAFLESSARVFEDPGRYILPMID
ncbi:MAG: hypothetical protein ABJG15_03940 [Hyphomonadaceae bacterium]